MKTADIELVQSRFMGKASNEKDKKFATAIRLFTTNREVDDHNALTQCQREVPIAEIRAEHSCDAARQTVNDVAGKLDGTLWLSVGANIMLTKNLWTAVGLTNGARGTVVDIIYAPGTSPPALPLVILCHFPRHTGPSFETARPRIVAVAPCTSEWGRNRQFSRTQFPLRLCDAMTIHKHKEPRWMRWWLILEQKVSLLVGLPS